jgi:hypothetical protein
LHLLGDGVDLAAFRGIDRVVGSRIDGDARLFF